MCVIVNDDRYSRQTRFNGIGSQGQCRLREASVVVVGVGALGSVIAEQLTRAGVGKLRLLDRDIVELSNLQRQTLYTEADAAAGRPKAEAAAEHLRAMNSEVAIEAHVVEVGPHNVATLLAGADVVLDGGDTFALRHLVNEACCQAVIPWVYAACVGAYALCMPIVPGATPCLRCLQDELPGAGDGPTCDTQGIIAPAVHIAAAFAVAEAMKIIVGAHDTLRTALWACDVWENTFQKLSLIEARQPTCLACGDHPTYPALNEPNEPSITLCGRDAVQIRLGRPLALDLIAQHCGAALISQHPEVIRWQDGDVRATAFKDGRVLVHGLGDAARARGFVARWIAQ